MMTGDNEDYYDHTTAIKIHCTDLCFDYNESHDKKTTDSLLPSVSVSLAVSVCLSLGFEMKELFQSWTGPCS